MTPEPTPLTAPARDEVADVSIVTTDLFARAITDDASAAVELTARLAADPDAVRAGGFSPPMAIATTGAVDAEASAAASVAVITTALIVAGLRGFAFPGSSIAGTGGAAAAADAAVAGSVPLASCQAGGCSGTGPEEGVSSTVDLLS